MAPKTPVVNRRDDADVPAEGLRLWAPWRYAYLRSLLSDPNACIFCFGKLSDAERRERLVLFENRDVLVMLNKYPYSNGHIMVAPRSHVASLELLSRTDRAVLIDAVAASIKLMRENLHWHIVPRWSGDNNFMSVLASTRVLSQSLEDSYEQLRPIFKNLGAELS